MAETAATAEAEGGAGNSATASATSGNKPRKAKPRASIEREQQSEDTAVDNSDGGGVRPTTLEQALGYLTYIDSTIQHTNNHDWALSSLVIKGNVTRCCEYIRAHLLTGEAPTFE